MYFFQNFRLWNKIYKIFHKLAVNLKIGINHHLKCGYRKPAYAPNKKTGLTIQINYNALKIVAKKNIEIKHLCKRCFLLKV